MHELTEWVLAINAIIATITFIVIAFGVYDCYYKLVSIADNLAYIQVAIACTLTPEVKLVRKAIDDASVKSSSFTITPITITK